MAEITLESIAHQLEQILREALALRGDIAEMRDRIQTIEARVSHLAKRLEDMTRRT